MFRLQSTFFKKKIIYFLVGVQLIYNIVLVSAVQQHPSMPIFLKNFNHKWVLNFVKGFFCIY